ncbi:hypothetical protein [Agaricicola taiwanensis]|uniref:hypothetical protein n=1 Tax=Agaricicola taiwanensis TaxID=591372 RepID=UPI00166809AA|nr:hypothetical protein [Agaricicola taiwanensis]
MKSPRSVKGLEDLGRVRLSESFFMRDFLYSEIANAYGLSNIPENPDLAIAAGSRLCQELLEPLRARFGRISIRSAFRSRAINQLGNERGHNCGSNESNYAGHIWDHRDAEGLMGATACVVVHAFIPYYEATGQWEAIAWWVHDHLPYRDMEFFPKFAAFNIGWHEKPRPAIYSFVPPRRGWLTKPGMPNHEGSHESEYRAFLASLDKA